MKNETLKTEIKNGQLVISIGINTLSEAVQQSQDWENWKIINNDKFANDVLCELTREDETGLCMIKRLFDDAAWRASDNGSEAVIESN